MQYLVLLFYKSLSSRHDSKLFYGTFNQNILKIQDYNPFLNILELFGILLPGTIISLLLISKESAKNDLIGIITFNGTLNTFLLGLIFLLASYFFGHIIFQIGTYLDDILYDNFKYLLYDHKELNIVKNIRNTHYTKENTAGLENNFNWAYLQLEASDNKSAFNEVQSLMAQAKFFRAMFVIAIGYVLLATLISQDPFEYWLLLTLAIPLIFFFIYVWNKKKLKNEKSNRLNLESFRWVLLSTLMLYLIGVGFIRNICLPQDQLIGAILIYAGIPLLSLFFYFKIRYKSIKTLYRQIIFQNRNLSYGIE